MSRKTIAANGAAGMIYTKSKKLYNYCLAISDRGKPQWRRGYDARNPKFNLFSSLNYNLDEISCAIGSISLKKINSTVKKRRDTTMLLKMKLIDHVNQCLLIIRLKDLLHLLFLSMLKMDIIKIKLQKN